MKHKISLSDIETIKNVYNKGTENHGVDINNEYNKRFPKAEYDINIVSSKTFFCDLNNQELVDVVKKNIPIKENEYISNIHYINYGVGEKAKPHVDTGASIRTFIMLLSNDFEGGDFYLEENKIDFQVGEIIEFDATLLHEVKTVTRGNREVLVVWLKWNNKNKQSLL